MLTPESIVSWLLEHPEVVADDADSLSSVYDSDTESASYDNALGVHGFGQYVQVYMFLVLSEPYVLFFFRVTKMVNYKPTVDAVSFCPMMNMQCMSVTMSKLVCW